MTTILAALVLVLAPPQSIPVPERARDPWVFRCVLDKKPRMATLALSKEMYVAYDATHCGLYKAWKGGVRFDGAVYTTEHGPQPTSAGSVYLEEQPRDVWSAEVGGVPVAAKARWQGYALHDGRATLVYSIELPDGRAVRVEETPEYVEPDAVDPSGGEDAGVARGSPGLMRSFRAFDLPADVRVLLALRTDGLAKIARALERERFVDVPGSNRAEVHSVLPLMKGLAENHAIVFWERLPDPPPPADAPKKEGAPR